MIDVLLFLIASATAEMPEASAKSAPSSKSSKSASVVESQVSEPVSTASTSFVAEDQTPLGKFTTAGEIRMIMDATKGNWVAVRDWEGQDLIYVTHIWSWRCGLHEVRIGVNGEAPEPWPLPPCHDGTATPNAILAEDGLPYRAFPAGSVETVQVDLLYDDLGTDTASFQRAQIMMP